MPVAANPHRQAYEDLVRCWLVAFDRGLLACGMSYSMDYLGPDLDAAFVRGLIGPPEPPAGRAHCYIRNSISGPPADRLEEVEDHGA